MRGAQTEEWPMRFGKGEEFAIDLIVLCVLSEQTNISITVRRGRNEL